MSARILFPAVFASLFLPQFAFAENSPNNNKTTVAEKQSLQLVESHNTIIVRHHGHDVLTYNKISPKAPDGIDKIYERSGCLHPITSPAGGTVTAMFPADHAHQHGVFSAWVNTSWDDRKIDFWNLAGGTGRVLHEKVVSRFSSNDKAGFEVDLLHRSLAEPVVDVLRERWKVTVYPTDGNWHCFDLDTVQNALTDKPLTVNQNRYGGMALRGPMNWLTSKDTWAKKHPGLVLEPTDFLNSNRSKREKANHEKAKWVVMTGEVSGNPVSIAVLCHSKNFLAPQTARIHPSKPYFCFAPCVEKSFVIDRQHPFKSSYRFLITDAKPDPDWLDKQWAKWCE